MVEQLERIFVSYVLSMSGRGQGGLKLVQGAQLLIGGLRR